MVKNKLKLMIIDDDKDICDFEKSYFEQRDFKVVVARTGLAALSLAKKVKPDIALIDIHLAKGIDGLVTLQRLLAILPQCKCIMSTWDKDSALQAIKMGAVDILIKPTAIEELERTVNRVAKSSKKARA